MFPQLLLLLGACITSTLAQADLEYLIDEILPRCFKHPVLSNQRLYVNGQDKTLANSLENFISLIEKLELANPGLKLDDELYILLKNYTAENVYYIPADVLSRSTPFLGIWKPTPAELSLVQNMWEEDSGKKLLDHNNPFDDNEKCSLFFMLSRTVNDTARPGIDVIQHSPSPEAAARSQAFKTLIPREQGVVSVNQTKTHAVALGRVLLGLYVGLKNERHISFKSIAPNKKNLANIEDVDYLYIVTLADQLVLANYPLRENDKKGLGGNGVWKSVKFPPNQNSRDEKFPICPTVYELPSNNTCAYTYSSVRGGVDGLILGEAIKDIYNSQPDIRLSQILQMYYGPNGLKEKSIAPPSDEKISFCTRTSKMAYKEDILKQQMRAYYALVSPQDVIEDTIKEGIKKFDDNKGAILEIREELKPKCEALERDKNARRCASAIDVIFVLDTTSDLDMPIQRETIGHLANNLDIGYGKSTITVFSDQRNGTNGLNLITVISNTSSSACAACSAMDFVIENEFQQAEKDVLIQSISEVLKNLEEQEKQLNGARGKVVIFFNFQDEETVSSRMSRALRNLYMDYTGVSFMAIGNNRDVLKTYTQRQQQNIISIVTTPESSDIAEILRQKICEVPAMLQYEDCANRISEGSAVFEGLLTPNTIQRWAMYPKYFYKSLTAKMFFQSSNGRQIEVCHSRSYSRAEDQPQHCHASTRGEPLEFNVTNPCRAFNDRNCAPWFFTVRLADETSTNGNGLVSKGSYCQDTNNLRCETLDQVKIKVTHNGIRCSSCFGLFPSPGLLLACFAIYIMNKLVNA